MRSLFSNVQPEAVRMALQVLLRRDFPALTGLVVTDNDGQYVVSYDEPATARALMQEELLRLLARHATPPSRPPSARPARRCADE